MKTIQKIQAAAIVVVMLMAVSLADSLEPTSGELAASIALVVSGGLMTINLVRQLEKKEADY
jgi:peptidoglycan biosynthesis protein MviN/MurJ (putative lipid II flippase)